MDIVASSSYSDLVKVPNIANKMRDNIALYMRFTFISSQPLYGVLVACPFPGSLLRPSQSP